MAQLLNSVLGPPNLEWGQIPFRDLNVSTDNANNLKFMIPWAHLHEVKRDRKWDINWHQVYFFKLNNSVTSNVRSKWRFLSLALIIIFALYWEDAKRKRKEITPLYIEKMQKGRGRKLPLSKNILPFETASQIFTRDQTLLFLPKLLLIWIGLPSDTIITFISHPISR